MDVETQPAFSPLYAVMNSVRSAQMLYMQLLTNPILTVPKQRSTQHHYPSGMVRTCALGESGVIVTHHCHLRARTVVPIPAVIVGFTPTMSCTKWP